jgi:hypothetical protein
MHYYLVTTYHGPIIYIDRGTTWAVASPNRPTETYTGALPDRCRTNAIPISASEAQKILAPGKEDNTKWAPKAARFRTGRQRQDCLSG